MYSYVHAPMGSLPTAKDRRDSGRALRKCTRLDGGGRRRVGRTRRSNMDLAAISRLVSRRNGGQLLGSRVLYSFVSLDAERCPRRTVRGHFAPFVPREPRLFVRAVSPRRQVRIIFHRPAKRRTTETFLPTEDSVFTYICCLDTVKINVLVMIIFYSSAQATSPQ